MLVGAVAEMISLGAVLPFLGALAAPERVFNHYLVAEMAPRFGITGPEQLLLPFTIFFVAAALAAGAVRLLQLWANTRFAYAVGHDLSTEVYRRTLYQPYLKHLSRNSSEIISGVDKVNSAIHVLLQLLTLLSSGIIALFVVTTLVIIDPLVSSVAFVGFGLIYVITTWITRRQLLRNSRRVAHEHVRRLKALQEGLGGIRDVLLGGKQAAYCNLYRRADWPMCTAQGNNVFISQSPRYMVEALGMVLIASLAYGLVRQNGEIVTVLPVLGALAMGAQRLLPTLHQIYSGWATITGHRASMEDSLELLDQPLPKAAAEPPPPPLEFHDNVCFEGVQFRYSPTGPLVLTDLKMTITRGSRIGFVGSTGSGKSTTLDLFMGLLRPTQGRILVDGLTLEGQLIRAWQRAIAHVPQSIFLSDSTLAENIAFGETLEEIDMERVKKAARQARIADFIESHPEGYLAMVGERGIRLSGGQRQRIGIARALYGQATVLVFDEATSALDNTTERAVMDAIDKLDRNLTILIIAHRLSTVKHCDLIVELGEGRVLAQGKYEELVDKSHSFRDMDKLGAV